MRSWFVQFDEAPAKAARRRANGTLILGRDIATNYHYYHYQQKCWSAYIQDFPSGQPRDIWDPSLLQSCKHRSGMIMAEVMTSWSEVPLANASQTEPHGLPPSILSLSEPSLGENFQDPPVGTPTFCKQSYCNKSGFTRLPQSEKGIGFQENLGKRHNQSMPLFVTRCRLSSCRLSPRQPLCALSPYSNSRNIPWRFTHP